MKLSGIIFIKGFDSQNIALMQSDLIFTVMVSDFPESLQIRKPNSNTSSP